MSQSDERFGASHNQGGVDEQSSENLGYRSRRRTSSFGHFIDLNVSLFQARLQFEASILRVAAGVLEAVADRGKEVDPEPGQPRDEEPAASLRRGRRELDRGLTMLDERLHDALDALRGR